MARQILLGNTWIISICEVLGINSKLVRRLIIDSGEPNDVVRVYVEMFGSAKLLDLSFPDPESVEVVILEKEEEKEPEEMRSRGDFSSNEEYETWLRGFQ